MSDQDASNNINVAIRVRPLNGRESKNSSEIPWQADHNSICLPGSTSFTFDKIFGIESKDNGTIFQEIAKPIVDATLMGFNGTIFAYGQTSAGKTYTMKGSEDNIGIVTLSIEYIFKQIEKNTERVYNVRCSYLEIYNEVITDLLKSDNTNLKIHESLSSGIFVGNLSEEPVYDLKEAISLLIKGEEKRQVGSTNINEHSSRSHTLFKLVIESRAISENNEDFRESLPSGPLNVSVLTFVDLAGSERVGQTGADGIRLKEGGHINKSLFSLTSVISKLADGNDRSHIPYRDSKLTRILQPSLGGNAKTAIICAITPAAEFVEESISTLKFASRAKTIKNKARINEIISDKEQIRLYKQEIEQLKSVIENLEDPAAKRRRLAEHESEVLKSIRKELYESVQLISTSAKYPEEISKICGELWEEVSFLKLELETSFKVNSDLLRRRQEDEVTIEGLKLIQAEKTKAISDLNGYKEKSEELELQYKTLYEEMTSVEEALMDDLSRMSTENDSLKVKLAELEANMASKDCLSCAQVHAQIDLFTESLVILEDCLKTRPTQEDLDNQEIAFGKKLDVLAKEKSDLEAAICSLRQDLVARENDILVAMESVANAKKIERTIEEKYEKQVASLDTELSRTKALCESLESERCNLASALSPLETKVQESAQVQTQLELQMDSFKSQLGLMNQELLAVNSRNASLEEALKLSREKELTLLDSLNKAQNDFIEAAKENESMKMQLAQQSGRAEGSDLLVKTLEDRLSESLMSSKSLELKLNDAVHELEQSTVIKSELEQKVQKSLDEQAALSIKINDLEAALRQGKLDISKVAEFWKDQLSSMKEDHSVECRTLRSECDRAMEDKRLLEVELERLSSQIGILKSDIEEGKNESGRLAKLLDRSNEQKSQLESDLIILQQKSETAQSMKASDVMLRIELEKTRDAFNKERKLLNLKINALEEAVANQKSNCDNVNLEGKLKRLEEENFRLNQLYQAGLHKIDYYASLINSKKADGSNQENIRPH